MIERILVAIDDSAPSLAAATFAVELARTLSGELNFVTVTEEGRDSEIILRHVTAIARESGIVPTLTAVEDGTHPFDAILASATAWNADLIVIGRSDIRRTGRPYIGSQTEHVLEFTEIPVVVVPERPPRRSSSHLERDSGERL
jgi:nucleotide-binding universal stress UspA family protein